VLNRESFRARPIEPAGDAFTFGVTYGPDDRRQPSPHGCMAAVLANRRHDLRLRVAENLSASFDRGKAVVL
jgi:hypothetical protein